MVQDPGNSCRKKNNKKASLIASLVGIPLEVDSTNIKRWEFIRVKIGCRDITKVPAVVEGMLDFHFYDFTFQREVPQEGVTNAAGTSWTRTTDRPSGDFPSPKKPRWGDGTSQQDKGSEAQGNSVGNSEKNGHQRRQNDES